MTKWLRRLRAALLMGLIWAVVWLPVGLLIGMILDPDGSMDEPWIAVGTLPGFLAGVMFSVVLGIAARHRSLDELSVAKVGGWGAVAGVLLSAFLFLSGELAASVELKWLLPLVVISSVTVLSAASAAGSLLLAKKSAKRELPGAGVNAAE